MESFAPGTDRAGSYKLTNIPGDSRPPEAMAEKDEGTVDSCMTRQFRRMSPLKDLWADCRRDKQTSRRTTARIWNVLLGFLNHRLNLPRCCPHHTGGWNDGIISWGLEGE